MPIPAAGECGCWSRSICPALTRELVVRHASESIRVNAICPGIVPTGLTRGLLEDPAQRELRLGQIPASRFGSVQEVASAIQWLISPGAAFVTGICLPVDGGASAAFIPRRAQPWRLAGGRYCSLAFAVDKDEEVFAGGTAGVGVHRHVPAAPARNRP